MRRFYIQLVLVVAALAAIAAFLAEATVVWGN